MLNVVVHCRVLRNFNTNLKYLNLSGNKRLQIKGDPSRTTGHVYKGHITTELSGFTSLKKLKVLGLMDVTITPTAKDTAVDIPDETADRRIRTSLSTVCGMGYGIADSLGKNDALNMVDLVHEFHCRKDEALFAMFGRTDPCKGVLPGTSTNYLSKFLHDHFVGVFMTQMAAIKEKQLKEGLPEHQWNDGIPKALHWTFLKLNQDLHESLRVAPRKNSQASINSHVVAESQLYKTGVSGIVLYFVQKTLFAANVGDALAVVSRQGVAQEVSRKHDPYDRLETARIRAAEGYISPPGLVNDEVDVSRSFGFFRDFPTLNAKPDIFVYNLSEMDEFVIIANRGLWDFVPFQTAVDIARTVVRMERPDPMLAAQKLRDFAISYGADGSTMIMVISLFDSGPRSRQPTLDPIADPHMYRSKKKDEVRDRGLNRLHEEVSPPTGQVTLVFTDIRNSTHLWEANPGMATAMRLHNSLLRRQLRFCGGYEVKTEGDAFMCSFPTVLAAVWWCLSVQRQLLEESWPLEILECEDGKPIYDSDEHLIARGLSVRMGIHSGMPLCETDPITHRMDYFGPMVNRSARINGSALGGQIMCSADIILEINAKILDSGTEMELSKEQSVEAIRRIGVVVIPMGEYKMKGIELPELLSVIYPLGLEGRHELKEAPVDPTASGSRVQFSVPQMQELGLLCLRIEAISSGRVFKPTPERKGSIQSGNYPERNVGAHTFTGDPNVLLPPINDTSSDSDLMLLLDSLTLRIENAVNTLYMKLRNSGVMPCSRSSRPLQTMPESVGGSTNAGTLVDALMEEGVLDESTLKYISSFLRRL
jgi:adenylate cyclase